MATHSSVLAWRIPGMGELPSMGSHRVRHDRSNLAAAYMLVTCISVKLGMGKEKLSKEKILELDNGDGCTTLKVLMPMNCIGYYCLIVNSCPILRLLCPWDFPGKHTGVGGHFLLQGIFPTQRLNPCLLH